MSAASEAVVEPCSKSDMTREEAKLAFLEADAVCFDVDSTVVTTEGVDEFAAFLGVGDKVAELTASAMNGDMKFHEALDARLSIMGATASSLAAFVEEHPATFTPGVERLIATLQARGTHVYLVSGGFTQMIFPLAHRLSLPRDRVFANTILFGDDGEYSGFDQTARTAWAGGKAKVISELRKQFGYPIVAMVGDGATDLEARPPADVFVGFGGIAQRPEVMANADLWVTDFSDVQAILDEAEAAKAGAEAAAGTGAEGEPRS